MAYDPAQHALKAFGDDKVETIRHWRDDYCSDTNKPEAESILRYISNIADQAVKNQILADQILEGFLKTYGKNNDDGPTQYLTVISELRHSLEEVTRSPNFNAEKLAQIVCLMHLSAEHGIASGNNWFLFGYSQAPDNLDELLQARLDKINQAIQEDDENAEELTLDNLEEAKDALKASLRAPAPVVEPERPRAAAIINPEKLQKLDDFFRKPENSAYEFNKDATNNVLVFEKKPAAEGGNKLLLSIKDNELEMRKSAAETTVDDYKIMIKAALETFSKLVIYAPSEQEKTKIQQAIDALKTEPQYQAQLNNKYTLTTDEAVYTNKLEEAKREVAEEENAEENTVVAGRPRSPLSVGRNPAVDPAPGSAPGHGSALFRPAPGSSSSSSSSSTSSPSTIPDDVTEEDIRRNNPIWRSSH